MWWGVNYIFLFLWKFFNVEIWLEGCQWFDKEIIYVWIYPISIFILSLKWFKISFYDDVYVGKICDLQSRLSSDYCDLFCNTKMRYYVVLFFKFVTFRKKMTLKTVAENFKKLKIRGIQNMGIFKEWNIKLQQINLEIGAETLKYRKLEDIVIRVLYQKV